MTPLALVQIMLLIVEKGLPAAVELLANLKKEDPTPEEIRALSKDVKPPEDFGGDS